VLVRTHRPTVLPRHRRGQVTTYNNGAARVTLYEYNGQDLPTKITKTLGKSARSFS
jgi:YD repeat-containing protein